MERHHLTYRPNWRQAPRREPSPNLQSLRDHAKLVSIDCEFMDKALRHGPVIPRDVWMTWRGLLALLRDQSALITMLSPDDMA